MFVWKETWRWCGGELAGARAALAGARGALTGERGALAWKRGALAWKRGALARCTDDVFFSPAISFTIAI